MTIMAEQSFMPPDPEYVANYETGEEMVASYDDYRALCDNETDGFRHIGVQGPRSYDAVIEDTKTTFCLIDGKRFPAVAPIRYEKMYDEERCKKLTGKEDIMLLAVPLSRVRGGVLLGNLVGGKELSPDFAVVVEEPRPPKDRETDHSYLASSMAGLGKLSMHEFVHSRLKELEDNRTAWMAMYTFSVEAVAAKETTPVVPPGRALEAAWDGYCRENEISSLPSEDTNDTYLFTAQQLRDNPDIMNALWAISEAGFGKVLGKYHPVSMEFTREFFDQQLRADGIYTAVRYHEGNPVCFGSLALDMEHNDWIDCNSKVIREELQAATDKGEIPAHFFELISNGPTGMSFSPDILKLYLDLLGRMGSSCRVFFESTNLSSIYIPRIITDHVEASTKVRLNEPIKMLEKQDYWYLATD